MSHLDDHFDAEGGDSQQPGADWEELPEIDHQDERSHHQENADPCKIKFKMKIWETARPETIDAWNFKNQCWLLKFWDTARQENTDAWNVKFNIGNSILGNGTTKKVESLI